MPPLSPIAQRTLRHAGILVAIMGAGIMLGGCTSTGDVTGSIGASAALPSSQTDLRLYADEWGRRYEAAPADQTAGLNYARALRALTQYNQAVAVLQNLSIKHPNDMEVLGAYGKALADAGRLQEAAEILQRAHTPERPNWNILSAQGSVADQLGDHEQAQRYYSAALKIVPNDPTVLSNLGLSYALSKQLSDAENTLRQAAAGPSADMRVRQNLALVLALQGKFQEAEDVSRHDLPPAEAAANVASIRQMISQSNTWRDIRKLDDAKRKAS